MLDHHSANPVQVVRPKSARPSELHWTQPELGRRPVALDMDMGRLRTLKTVEEEAKAADV
jgi:hypothetical protein